MLKKTLVVLVAAVGIFLTASPALFAQDEPTQIPGETDMTTAAPQTGYVSVNGLEIYYEIHGTGEPLVVLHGAYMSIVSMGEIVPRLAETRQVIAIELQGHGRTADIDRPLTYEAMADDVSALMQEIGVEKADFYGYSMGGNVALQMAIRHPEQVNKLAVASPAFSSDGYQPGFFEMLESITPELFAGTPITEEYARLAPNPDAFPTLVEKLVELDRQPFDWSSEIEAITAPTLLIFGDADAVTPEHAVEFFRLLGGGVNGDMVGLPNVQLAILPATTHIGVAFRTDWLTLMIAEFLNTSAPAPQAG